MSDYYDYRTEERMKVTLAESSLLEQLVSITRFFEDFYRQFNSVLEAASEGDTAKVREAYERLRGLKARVENVKDNALSYLARVGWYLPTADILRETFLLVNRCVQLIDGVAHKILLLMECGSHDAKTKIVDAVRKLSTILFEQVNTLTNSTRLLLDNPRGGYELGGRIISLEERMDTEYRKTLLDLYRSLGDDLLGLMLARDIVELVEDSSDLLRDAAENIRFLAVSRASRT